MRTCHCSSTSRVSFTGRCGGGGRPALAPLSLRLYSSSPRPAGMSVCGEEQLSVESSVTASPTAAASTVLKHPGCTHVLRGDIGPFGIRLRNFHLRRLESSPRVAALDVLQLRFSSLSFWAKSWQLGFRPTLGCIVVVNVYVKQQRLSVGWRLVVSGTHWVAARRVSWFLATRRCLAVLLSIRFMGFQRGPDGHSAARKITQDPPELLSSQLVHIWRNLHICRLDVLCSLSSEGDSTCRCSNYCSYQFLFSSSACDVFLSMTDSAPLLWRTFITLLFSCTCSHSSPAPAAVWLPETHISLQTDSRAQPEHVSLLINIQWNERGNSSNSFLLLFCEIFENLPFFILNVLK